jgi:hypothetical protein
MNGIVTSLSIDLQRCRFLAREPLATASAHAAIGRAVPCGAPRALTAIRPPRRCGYASGPGPGATGPDPDASRRAAG